MKTWKIFWGVGFILAALLLILDALGVMAPFTAAVGGVSVVSVILGLFLAAVIFTRIVRGKISEIFFPLAFIFMLFEKNIAVASGLSDENIINNGLVLLIALLLTVGTLILFPVKICGHIHIDKGSSGKYKMGKNVRAENSLGSTTVYVDCENMTPSHFENSLGSYAIHFSNIEKYIGGGTINVENNLGSTVINVPAQWYANVNDENNLGSVSVQKKEHFGEPVININVENNLGSVSVRYV